MANPSICPANTDRGLPQADVELADVVRRFGPEYISPYGHVMLPSQQRALADIAACCTKELGGRLYRCDDCSESFWRFHCCRNRACPKCHGKQTQAWLEKRQGELLPCGYFHAVATVPPELRDAFRRHQKFMYGLLMRVSAEAVRELCAKKRHLGALPGILSVLHTSNGELDYHPHVHMLITGGGISSDGEHWEPARGEFLVPVHVLSRKIAAKFRDALQKQAQRVCNRLSRHLAARVGIVLQALRLRQRCRAELPVPVRIPHRDQQCTDSRHGRHTRDVPLQGPKHRHLANRATARCRVPAAIPATRTAARLSQVSLLQTVASLEASLGQSGLAALDTPEADGLACPDGHRGPA